MVVLVCAQVGSLGSMGSVGLVILIVGIMERIVCAIGGGLAMPINVRDAMSHVGSVQGLGPTNVLPAPKLP